MFVENRSIYYMISKDDLKRHMEALMTKYDGSDQHIINLAYGFNLLSRMVREENHWLRVEENLGILKDK